MIRQALSLFAALTLMSGAAAASGWEAVESTKWVPLSDAGATAPVHLTTTAGEAIHGTWRLLDAGDTLRFPIRGSGTLRVETRAVLGAGESGAEFRIGVRTAPGTVRPLLRRSSGARDVRAVDGRGPVRELRVAAIDVWETALVAGSESIEVFLRPGQHSPVLVRVLARGDLERPAVAGERATDVEWDFLAGYAGAGFNTNAYMAPSDSNAAETAFFWPLELEAAVQVDPGGRFGYGFAYDFSGTFHADEILNVYRHRAEAWQRWDDLTLGRFRGVEFQLNEEFRTRNRTYFGRGYSEEIETGSGNPPAQDSALADRYDWREGSLVAGLEFGPRTGVGTDFSVGYVRRDYVEDYENDPDTYALDHGEFVAGFRLRWRNQRDFFASAGVGVEDRRYDEKFARDVDGVEVRSVTTHLTYWPVEFDFGHRPASGLRWKAGLEAERIVDRYEGYWDRTVWRAGVDLDWVARRGYRVGVGLDRSLTDYDRSRVGNAADGPIREKDVWLLRLDGEVRLDAAWRLGAYLEFKDRNNNSPTFAYSAWESMAGLSRVF